MNQYVLSFIGGLVAAGLYYLEKYLRGNKEDIDNTVTFKMFVLGAIVVLAVATVDGWSGGALGSVTTGGGAAAKKMFTGNPSF